MMTEPDTLDRLRQNHKEKEADCLHHIPSEFRSFLSVIRALLLTLVDRLTGQFLFCFFKSLANEC